jgi:hypothetical protein
MAAPATLPNRLIARPQAKKISPEQYLFRKQVRIADQVGDIFSALRVRKKGGLCPPKSHLLRRCSHLFGACHVPSPPLAPEVSAPNFRACLSRRTLWIAGNHKRTMARPILATGAQVTCRIIDLSESGVVIAVSPEMMPAIGTVVTVGKTSGRGRSVILTKALPLNSPACSTPTSSRKPQPPNEAGASCSGRWAWRSLGSTWVSENTRMLRQRQPTVNELCKIVRVTGGKIVPIEHGRCQPRMQFRKPH